jgi:ATP phosphoribosyltransferase
MAQTLTIALSKGRILKDTLPLLAQMGVEILDDLKTTRKLILDTNHPHIKAVVVRATDAPTYVEYGAADIGIAGKDVLMEHGGKGIYELLDLKIAQCKLMTAGMKDTEYSGRARLRVATKYVNSARQYFAQQGQMVDIIKLYGSMELAPLVGLADMIVDLVDTGNTLKANGLVPLEHIADISSRLIVNQASMKTKSELLNQFVADFEQVMTASRA